MSKPEIINLSHVFGLFDLKGLYLIGYAWLFGMCELVLVSMVNARSHESTILWTALWVTFFGGTLQKLYVLHVPVLRHTCRCHCL